MIMSSIFCFAIIAETGHQRRLLLPCTPGGTCSQGNKATGVEGIYFVLLFLYILYIIQKSARVQAYAGAYVRVRARGTRGGDGRGRDGGELKSSRQAEIDRKERITMSSKFTLTETKYGFQWGPAIVERACSDEKLGVMIHVRSGKHMIEIRITPSGLLRVGNIIKSEIPATPFERIAEQIDKIDKGQKGNLS